MRKYAEGTTVPIEKSRIEFEALIKKNHAKNCISIETDDGLTMIFEMNDRRLKFTVNKPSRATWSEKEKQAEYRRLFRVLILRMKTKLEAAASADISFDEEFLPNIMDKNGVTVWETIKPQLPEFEIAKMPKLLT